MSREILVTGASGFIGRQLSSHLTTLGFVVRRTSRSQVLESSESAGWITVGDIDSRTDWCASLAGGIDAIVHLAGRAHIMRHTTTDPLAEYSRVNVEGSLNLARQAAAAKVKRFIYISSIGVNGNESYQRPFTVTAPPAPHSLYAVSKYEAELGLLEIAEQTGLEVVIIRPPLVYGPGAPGNFGSLVRWLSRGVPLPLGAIHNQRSLVGIDNLIDLIITCIDHPAAANQTFLVSDDEDLSTTVLLRRLGAALGKPARLLPVPASLLKLAARLVGKQDIAQRLLGNLQVDISNTREILNWTPPISVDAGLRKTAQWYLSQR